MNIRHFLLGMAGMTIAGITCAAHAQLPTPTGKVVASCGAQSYSTGTNQYVTMLGNGNACTAAATTPSGTQNVNITGINSAAPSLTNPIFTAFAEAGDTTGTFTNATQTTAVTATNGDGYGTALISIHGTYGTATATFLASDDSGVTTYPLICTRSDNTASEIGYTTLTNTNRQWSCPISGNDTVIVQSSAVATGTVNVRISIVASPNATTVNGTVNVAAITGATSNASSGVATSSTNIPSVSYNYGWNGTTWDQLKTAPALVTTGVGLSASGIAAIFNTSAPILTNGQYGLLQMSPQGGLGLSVLNGTAYASLYTAVNAPNSGVGSVSAGVTSVFNTTLPTYTNGQYGMLQMSSDGSLRVAPIAESFTATRTGLGQNIGFLNNTASNTSGSFYATQNVLYNGATSDVAVSINGAIAAGTGTAATHVAPTSNINASTTAGQCTVACASLIVSGAHNIYGAGFSSTATGWLLLEDATSCAANGTVTPLRAYAYPTAGVTQTLSWGDVPRSVATGMALCFSTSGPYTATASTTAFIWADYK